MFDFFDNTPHNEKKDSNKDKFSKFNGKPAKKEVEGFEMMNGKLQGSEYMSNKMELFNLETTKDSMKNGLESLVAMVPGKKESMKTMEKKEMMSKKENMDVMGIVKDSLGLNNKKEPKNKKDKKEKMGQKKKNLKKEGMTLFAKEGMENEDMDMDMDMDADMDEDMGEDDIMKELERLEKEGNDNSESEGMANMNMDKNTQIFAGGITIVALLLVFKFMQKK